MPKKKIKKRKPGLRQSKTASAQDGRAPMFVNLDDPTETKKSKSKSKNNNNKSKSKKQSKKKDRGRSKTVNNKVTKNKKSKSKPKSKKNNNKLSSNDDNRKRAKSQQPKKKSKKGNNKAYKLKVTNDDRVRSKTVSPNKKNNNLKVNNSNNDNNNIRAKSVSPKQKKSFKQSFKNIFKKTPKKDRKFFGKKKPKHTRSNSVESVALGKKNNGTIADEQKELDAFEAFILAQKQKQNKKSSNNDDEWDRAFDEAWDAVDESKDDIKDDSESDTGGVSSKKKHHKKKHKKHKKDKDKKSKHKKDKKHKKYGIDKQESVKNVNKRNQFKANQPWHHKKRSSLPTYNTMRKRQATLQFHIDKERNRNLATLNYDTDKRKKSKEYKNLSGGGFQIRVNYRYRLKDNRIGVCRFKGRTLFGKSYQDWIGIVVEHGTGEHDGTVQGKSYFKCRDGKGIMVLPSYVVIDLGTATKPLTKQMIKDAGKIKTKAEMKTDNNGRWSSDNYKADHGPDILAQKTFYSTTQLHANKGKHAPKKKRHFEV